ncbi:MAG TPA: flagellar biosynthesis protein FlgE [Clostridiaceae bacterium]|jgi:flagellar hook protein FlgE|nr:flagellar biosynthesis protein FlgE [Clostridiaceae bacterium]
MLRSLFSGVSGMKSQQTKMDVIGNNVANVSTTAFKSGRATFKDALSQTEQAASSPTTNMGGINPKSVGLGVSVSAIDTNMGQGYLQPTGGKTDLAIEGNGMFIVSKLKDTDVPTSATPDPMEETYYTRDGSFKLDKDGNLLTADGYYVMGKRDTAVSFGTGDDTSAMVTIPDKGTKQEPVTIDDTTKLADLEKIVIPLTTADKTTNITDFSIEQDGTIKALYGEDTVIIGKIAMATFQNVAGLEKKGGNLYQVSPNSGDENSGDEKIGTANSSGFGKMVQGHLEMSNVDLANEFTDMIITSRAFQANSRTITTSDEMLQELLNLKR